MAGNTKDVNLRARLKGSEKVSKGLGRVDKGLSRLAKSAIATAGAFLGARMLYEGMKSIINAAKEQELQERKLAQVIKSTGSAAGMSAQEFTNMASALQKQTRFGDETIIQAQSLMLTFTKVGKEVMPDAIETVLNMSEAMGTDLRSTVIQVGKALNDPILGVTALRRVGVQLSDQQMQQVDDFMAVNDVAGAQKVILGELETQFGGLAIAAGEGLAGSLDKAKNAMGDAAEDIGQLLAPAIINVSNWFSNAAQTASDFFKETQETGLETTIRELQELGVETLEYEKILSQLNLADLGRAKHLGTEKKLTEDLNTIVQEFISKKRELAKLQGDAIEDGKAEEAIRKRLNEITTKIGMASGEIKFQVKSMHAEEKAILEEKLKQFDSVRAEIEQLEEKKNKSKEDLDLLRAYNLEKERLETINLRLAKQGTEGGDGEDPGKMLMILTEDQKTQILKDAAAERKIIQQDELIGEMTREAYEFALDRLKLHEDQKTQILKDFDEKKKKRREKANREEIQDNLKTAILNGQTAKEAAKSVIKAEIAEAQASLISSIMEKLPFPINLLVAAGAGAMIGKVTDELFNFPTGGSFITHKKTTLPIGDGVVVGDNASGMHRVDITPLPSPNQVRSGNITININAPIGDEYVVDSIIPAIERAKQLNL